MILSCDKEDFGLKNKYSFLVQGFEKRKKY